MADIFVMLGLSIFIFVVGIKDFKKIYPIRYGKEHIELQGRVIGEDSVITRSGSAKCPVIEFVYRNKRYKLADTTYLAFQDYKVGDMMTVCFNPNASENVVIIKRGKYNLETL